MKMPLKRNIVEVISAMYIFLFVYTAFNKLLVLGTLQKVLKEYPLIGDYASLVSWGLPVTELIIAVLIFLPRTRLAGLYCSLFLMAGFTLYLGYMLVFTPHLPCTCGGMLEKLSWPEHFVLNIFLILLSIIGIILHKKDTKKPSTHQDSSIVFT